MSEFFKPRFWVRFKAKMEFAFPLSIAIFASVLALNDLFSGKYGSDEIKLTNDRNNSYQWYQSKGIKETILEGQMDLLQTLMASGSIAATHSGAIQKSIEQTAAKVERYKKEKREILQGSKAVGPGQWIQEVDGKMGQVIGANEYDGFIAKLGEAAEFFDLASMLFQVCLVIGAIGILMQREQLKWSFYKLMLGTGSIGILLFAVGLWLATRVELT